MDRSEQCSGSASRGRVGLIWMDPTLQTARA